MTSIVSLLRRVDDYTQDADHTAWSPATKLAQLRDVMASVARQELLGDILWVQGVTGQDVYPVSPDAVRPQEVLYDGRSLRKVTDASLARHRRQWHSRTSMPQVYTTVTEAPLAIRITPAPLFTGSAVPQMPGLPVMQREGKNLLVFAWVDPQGDAVESGFPEVLDDVLVFRTVAALCLAQTEFQDRQKGMVFQGLADLLLRTLLDGNGRSYGA